MQIIVLFGVAVAKKKILLAFPCISLCKS